MQMDNPNRSGQEGGIRSGIEENLGNSLNPLLVVAR
jgi:hypothetical protein